MITHPVNVAIAFSARVMRPLDGEDVRGKLAKYKLAVFLSYFYLWMARAPCMLT
jgi:hypothetical protein